MKRILVTTDFSRPCQNTLDFVLDHLFQENITAKIFLLNTYLVQETDPGRALAQNDELKRQSKEGLANEIWRVSRMLKPNQIEIEPITQLGSLPNVIPLILKIHDIDLLAMPKDGGKHIELISPIGKVRI